MAILGNMPRSLINLMLAILRKKFNATNLPKDARTLLKTPTRVGLEIKPISGGDFWYQGIETVMQKYFHYCEFWSKACLFKVFLCWRIHKTRKQDVIIADRHHLNDLGVTKKLFQDLIKHTFYQFRRWSPQENKSMTNYLIKTRLPSEIHRRMRNLKNVNFWKGSEFRTFLHYISPVALKDFMLDIPYNHFLLYFCGVTIFSSSAHQHLWLLAKKFLETFVKDFSKYYGRAHLTSNVHNLQHVYGDVAKFGQLDDFSAYCFENHLQFVKRTVRSGRKVAAQVAGRTQELATIETAANCTVLKYPQLKANGVGLHVTAHFVLLPNFKDQWFLTTDNGIVKFLDAKRIYSSLPTIIGIQYNSWTELFSVSVDDDLNGTEELKLSSTDINIYKLSGLCPSRKV
uniref:Uncharacterized protein n=1 Tax=Anopheles dirus TaxID=7168 RepID=A0A182NMY9_9DIPT